MTYVIDGNQTDFALLLKFLGMRKEPITDPDRKAMVVSPVWEFGDEAKKDAELAERHGQMKYTTYFNPGWDTSAVREKYLSSADLDMRDKVGYDTH